MAGLFSAFVGFFLNSQVRSFLLSFGKWAAILGLIGFLGWMVLNLQKQNAQIALQYQNADLKSETNALKQQALDTQAKQTALIQSLQTLSDNLQKNSADEQATYQSMIDNGSNEPKVVPQKGQSMASAQMEAKANSGMNTLFSDLNTLSKDAK